MLLVQCEIPSRQFCKPRTRPCPTKITLRLFDIPPTPYRTYETVRSRFWPQIQDIQGQILALAKFCNALAAQFRAHANLALPREDVFRFKCSPTGRVLLQALITFW